MANNVDTNIIDKLNRIEAEFAKLEKMIASLYTYMGKGSDYNTLLSRRLSAEFMGVSIRQFDRLAEKYCIERIDTFAGPRYRRKDLTEIITLTSAEQFDEPKLRALRRRMELFKNQASK